MHFLQSVINSTIFIGDCCLLVKNETIEISSSVQLLSQAVQERRERERERERRERAEREEREEREWECEWIIRRKLCVQRITTAIVGFSRLEGVNRIVELKFSRNIHSYYVSAQSLLALKFVLYLDLSIFCHFSGPLYLSIKNPVCMKLWWGWLKIVYTMLPPRYKQSKEKGEHALLW